MSNSKARLDVRQRRKFVSKLIYNDDTLNMHSESLSVGPDLLLSRLRDVHKSLRYDFVSHARRLRDREVMP
jgi:hypothetical protein